MTKATMQMAQDCLGRIKELEKENAELKEQNNHLYNDLTMTEAENAERKDQLSNVTALLKKMYYLYFDPCVTHKDLENRDKLFEEVKQFIKDIEK